MIPGEIQSTTKMAVSLSVSNAGSSVIRPVGETGATPITLSASTESMVCSLLGWVTNDPQGPAQEGRSFEMTKKKAIKVHFNGIDEYGYTWSVRGNDTRMDKGSMPWRRIDSDKIEASFWTPWSSPHHPVSRLFRNSKKKGISIDHKSGKKEKKFWRRVLRRIERLTK